MTPAELRTAAHQLGLSGNAMAAALGVSRRTWRRWLAGQAIPAMVNRAVDSLLREKADLPLQICTANMDA